MQLLLTFRIPVILLLNLQGINPIQAVVSRLYHSGFPTKIYSARMKVLHYISRKYNELYNQPYYLPKKNRHYNVNHYTRTTTKVSRKQQDICIKQHS